MPEPRGRESSHEKPAAPFCARRLLVALALLALPTLLLGPALRPSRAFLPADLLVQFEPWRSQLQVVPEARWDALVWDGIAQYYPWRQFAAETLRAGHVPLWNPYQFCGTPFLANGQSAVFYPPNLLFWLLPTALAFAWSAWLHLLLAGWFAYLFLRRGAGVGRLGALAGAMVWQANGFTVAWLHLPTTLCTLAWLPLVLLCCDRALLTGKMRYALAAGLALGLSYLGGHPQAFLYAALLTAAYILLRGLARCFGTSVPKLPVALTRLALTGLLTAALALTLAAVQLLPTLDFLPATHRTFTPGPASYIAFLQRALQPPQLAGFVLPHPLGHPGLGTYLGPENYAEYTLYLGLVALALALWGGLLTRTWHARFLLASAVVALLLALGTSLNWPLYHWLPGWARTGGPARVSVVTLFCLSLLAGIGLDGLARQTRLLPRLLWVGLVALLALGARHWTFAAGPILGKLRPALPTQLQTELVTVLVLAGLALALGLLLRTRRQASALQVGLLLVLGVDLLLAARGHLHIVPRAWVYAECANPGPSSGRVLANAADWPLDRFPKAVLPPNAATVYHLRDVAGYDSLYLAPYRDFAALLQGGDPSPSANGNMLLLRWSRVYDRGVMQLAGVDRILSAVPLPELSPTRAEGYYVYDHLGGWPRARVVESAVFCADTAQARQALSRLGALPNLAIITGTDVPAPRFGSGAAPTAELTDLSPNAVSVRLPRGGGGYLLLTDTYAPGWHAYGDGRPLPVRPAYLTFRAVPLPQDVREVEFRYEPASFRLGLFLSLLALGGIAAALGALLTPGMKHVR